MFDKPGPTLEGEVTRVHLRTGSNVLEQHPHDVVVVDADITVKQASVRAEGLWLYGMTTRAEELCSSMACLGLISMWKLELSVDISTCLLGVG